MQTQSEHKDTTFKGIFCACVAFALFALMSMFNKLLAGQHGAIEISFYRNLVSILPFAAYFLMTRKYGLLKIKKRRLLVVRCVVGTFGLFATLMATQILPLSYATVLFFVSTLVVPIIAVLFLKETIGVHRIVAIIVGLIGVIIVVRPSGEVSALGVVVALIAGVAHAVIQTSLRGLKDENPEAINFYFFSSAFVISALFMPFVYSPPTPQSLLMMLGVAVSALVAHFFLTRAFKYAQASVVSPFNYTGLLWATIFDVTIWQVWPQMSVWLGAVLIIGSSIYIIYRERKTKRSV